MASPTLASLLPQLASGAAHTHALGFAFDGLEGDRVRIRAPWREDLVGDPDTGVLSGGLVTALLDHTGGLAVWIALDRFEPIATLDLRVDYMRSATPGQRIRAEAFCYNLTRTVAFLRAVATDDDESRPVATATGAFTNSPGIIKKVMQPGSEATA